MVSSEAAQATCMSVSRPGQCVDDDGDGAHGDVHGLHLLQACHPSQDQSLLS